MDKTHTLVFINQTTGDLLVDVINAFSQQYHHRILLAANNKQQLENLDTTVKIDRIISYNKQSAYKRLFTWGIATLQIWFKVITRYRGMDLFIVSNPPFAILLPLFCKNRYSLLIYDTYPDILINSGIIKSNSLFAKGWKYANSKLFKRAMNLYTISEGMAECLSQYIDRKKIKVIHNWADTSFLKPVLKENNIFLKQYPFENKFIILYSGNMGTTHNVEAIVELANYMKENRNIAFILIGEGAKKKKIAKMIVDYELKNCTLLPYQSRDMLPHSLSAADIGVITLDDNTSQLSVPSKTYSMMAVGSVLMCIVNEKTELANIVSDYHVGKIFDKEDLEGMADFVNMLMNSSEKLLYYKMNSRNAAFHFTPKNAKKYVELYEI